MQKTAYELRISDWSSDVCSSDLLGNGPPVVRRARRRLVSARDSAVADARAGPRRRAAPAADAGLAGRLQTHAAVERLARGAGTRQRRTRRRTSAAHRRRRRRKDRKRVVSGKSVSVRVDLGGRRIIKKKNNTAK